MSFSRELFQPIDLGVPSTPGSVTSAPTSLRFGSRRPIYRLAAHVLARLLVLQTFPAPYQAVAAVFPFSMIVVAGEEKDQQTEDGGKEVSDSLRVLLGTPQTPLDDDGRTKGGSGNESRLTAETGSESFSPSARAASLPLGAQSRPTNLHLYSIAENPAAPKWVGSASFTTSAVDGFVKQIVLRNERVYAAAGRKGILIMDTQKVVDGHYECCAPNYWAMVQNLNTDGTGFNASAVVTTIPIPGFEPFQTVFTSLDVLQTGNGALIGTTGRWGFAVAPELQSSVTFNGDLTKGSFRLSSPNGQAASPPNLMSYALVKAADVQGQARFLLAGPMTTPGGYRNGVMVVDPSNPTAPVVVGAMELSSGLSPDAIAAATVQSIVVRGDFAYIGMSQPGYETGTSTFTSKPITAIVSLADEAHPQYAGQIEGVGGHLALGLEGSLLMGHLGSTFGNAATHGGVHNAALETITYIKRVTENPVILDIDRKSIETQEVEAVVFPPLSAEDRPGATAKLQLVNSQTQAVVRTLPATLDAASATKVTVPENQTHPTAGLRARLVVNDGKPDAPRATAKAIEVDQFVVSPTTASNPEDPDSYLESRGNSAFLLATSRAVARRITKARADGNTNYAAPSLTWGVAPTSTATALRVDPSLDLSATGGYEAEARAEGLKGKAQFELKSGSRILGRTALIDVLPGEATQTTFTQDKTAIPADGKSTVSLTLSNIKDAAGNTVANGTPVTWSIASDDGGRFKNQSTITANGAAVAIYEASIFPGDIPVKVHVGDAPPRVATITQAPLTVTLTMQGTTAHVTAVSSAGRAANDTEVLWALIGAKVVGADTLQSGEATGTWVQTDPDRAKQKEDVFVTIGRARGHAEYDRFSVLPAQAPRVSLDHAELIGDRVGSYTLTGAENTSVELPSSTTMRVENAAANSTVSLVLGTMKDPVYQPIVEFPLDRIDPGNAQTNTPATTPDLYAVASMAVPANATITLETARRFGALRLQDTAASISGLPDLRGAFGFNTYVRLDTLAAGQKIIEKIGSFSVETVISNGNTVFEFSVQSGGERKTVLSSQALAAQTWYHVAAHFRDGVLKIQVGDETPKQGESSGLAPSSTLPVIVGGGGFAGYIDRLRVYDFSLQPLFTFANGAETVEVPTDADGRASAPVVGTGSLRTSDASAFGTGFEVALGVDDRAHGGPSAVESEMFFQASGGLSLPAVPAVIGMGIKFSPQEQAQMAGNFAVYSSQVFGRCLDSLTSGEPADAVGWICEIGAGFTLVGGVLQGGRDAAISLVNFSQSKGDVRAYIAVTVGLGLAVVGVLPGARAVTKGVTAAKAARVASKLETAAARVVADESRLALRELAPKMDEVTTVFNNMADAAPAPVKQATQNVFEGFSNSPAATEALERLTKTGVMAAPELLSVLNRLKASGKYADDVIDKLVLALGRMPGLSRLSPEAIEGIAVLLKRRPKRVGDPEGIWNTLTTFSVAANPTFVMETIFARLKRADDMGLKDLDRILPQIRPGLVSLRGGFNHLDEAIDKAEAVIAKGGSVFGQEVTKKMLPGYSGRSDMITSLFGKLFDTDFKVFEPGTAKFGNADQITGKVEAAFDRALTESLASGTKLEDLLRDEFRRMEYIVRGAEDTHVGLRESFLGELRRGLDHVDRPDLYHLANEVSLVFRGKPFLF